MHPRFKNFVEPLEPKFQELIGMPPVKYSELPKHLPQKGLYLFSEGDHHLYVGRTNHLRERLRGHCIPSATHFTATFAFRIARGKTGFLKATRWGIYPKMNLKSWGYRRITLYTPVHHFNFDCPTPGVQSKFVKV